MVRLLVTGGTGLVGGNLCHMASTNMDVCSTFLTSHPTLKGIRWHRVDITQPRAVQRLFRAFRPDVVVHTAAMADIDLCETNREKAWAVNVTGTENVASQAEAAGVRLIHISTSNVFDGSRGRYSEEDEPAPINFYGRTKLESERIALSIPNALVARISLVLGYPRTSGRSALRKIDENLRAGRSVFLPEEEIRTPIDVWTLCSSLLALAQVDVEGIIHLAGSESVSRLKLGRIIAEVLGHDPSLVMPPETIPSGRAPRPRDVSLLVEKATRILGVEMPRCREAVARAVSWSKV